jgi:hypothetical protein
VPLEELLQTVPAGLSLPTQLSDLLTVPDGPRTWRDIMHWWESRRLAYNALLVPVGIGCALVGSRSRHGRGTGMVPYLVFVGLLLILPANIWYTLGWLSEIAVTWLSGAPYALYGPIAFSAGTAFSILFMVAVCLLLLI